MRDLLHNSSQKDLLPAKSRAAATYNGTGVDLKGKGRKVLILLSAGGFGASATLDVTIEESLDNTTFTTLYTFTQKTAAGSFVVDVAPTKRYIRATGVVGVAAVDFGVWGIVYNEREIPSGI